MLTSMKAIEMVLVFLCYVNVLVFYFLILEYLGVSNENIKFNDFFLKLVSWMSVALLYVACIKTWFKAIRMVYSKYMIATDQ